LVRAGLSAAIVLGLARWIEVVSARTPAFYDPDPTLPGSLADAIPSVDVLWAAARGSFGVAVLAATAALTWRSAFFRTAAGRALGIAAVVLVLMPSELRSPAEFGFELATGLLAAGWAGACAFGLLRDHPAAWALFGLFAFGGRGAVELLGQPAFADRASGWLALLLLAVAGAALLAGRRDAGTGAAAAAGAS
jgi:hypothetical protein